MLDPGIQYLFIFAVHDYLKIRFLYENIQLKIKQNVLLGMILTSFLLVGIRH